MEDIVGAWWDKLIRRVARRGYPAAVVRLNDVKPTASVVFRAFGGHPALKLCSRSEQEHNARRGLFQRLAHIGQRHESAGLDEQHLYLPEQLDIFPTVELNRDLYLWLLAQAAYAPSCFNNWFDWNRTAASAALTALPGMVPRYQRLVTAYLAERPSLSGLPADEAIQETLICTALRQPDTPLLWQPARRAPWPVPLWLAPCTDTVIMPNVSDATDNQAGEGESREGDNRRRNARQIKQEQRKDGMLMVFRAESLFSWDEYVKVNRHDDDEDDPDALKAADDMQHLTVSRDGSSLKHRLRFDLDLPAPAADDKYLGPGIKLPEWDWKAQALRENYCLLQPMLADKATPCPLPEALVGPARQLRHRFAALTPLTVRIRGETSGDDLDIDAWLRQSLESPSSEPAVFSHRRRQGRNLACLLLADLSLSTDTWVGNDARVIDVIRDSLFLFAEAMSASQDAFGIYGFSSVKRDHVRFQLIKDFQQKYDDHARGRIAAIKPGYYTRLGAALRQATKILQEQPAEQRLLLLLTDGKPNDLDHYEGRWGIEDSRHAVEEARAAGLIPFCVTVDRDATNYLPHLFGRHWALVDDARKLPKLLPQLYLKLTAQQG